MSGTLKKTKKNQRKTKAKKNKTKIKNLDYDSGNMIK